MTKNRTPLKGNQGKPLENFFSFLLWDLTFQNQGAGCLLQWCPVDRLELLKQVKIWDFFVSFVCLSRLKVFSFAQLSSSSLFKPYNTFTIFRDIFCMTWKLGWALQARATAFSSVNVSELRCIESLFIQGQTTFNPRAEESDDEGWTEMLRKVNKIVKVSLIFPLWNALQDFQQRYAESTVVRKQNKYRWRLSTNMQEAVSRRSAFAWCETKDARLFGV